MNKNLAILAAFAFILGFFGTINSAPVKPPKKVVATAMSMPVSPVSFGGKCARANKDNTCDSGVGEACISDIDCCGSLRCTGAQVTREGETYNTCQ